MSTVVYNNYGVGEEEMKDLLDKIETLTQKVTEMADAFSTLVDKVTRIEDVADSAIVLINGLRQQLADALNADTTDEEFSAEIQGIADRLDAQATELANAIATPGGETKEDVEKDMEPKPEDIPAPPEGEQTETAPVDPQTVEGGQAPDNLGDNATDGNVPS